MLYRFHQFAGEDEVVAANDLTAVLPRIGAIDRWDKLRRCVRTVAAWKGNARNIKVGGGDMQQEEFADKAAGEAVDEKADQEAG